MVEERREDIEVAQERFKADLLINRPEVYSELFPPKKEPTNTDDYYQITPEDSEEMALALQEMARMGAFTQ